MNLLSRLAQRTLEAGPSVRPVTPPVFAWKEIALAPRRAPSPLAFEEETASVPASSVPRHVRHSAPVQGAGGVSVAPVPIAERHETTSAPPLYERAVEAGNPEPSAPARRTITRKTEAEVPADFAPGPTSPALRPATTRAPQALEPLAELQAGHVAAPIRHPEPATPREHAVVEARVVAPPQYVTAIASVPAARAQTTLRNERTSNETVVQISIGRVEVRGIVPETPIAPIVPRGTSAALSLGEYLKQRDGGAR